MSGETRDDGCGEPWCERNREPGQGGALAHDPLHGPAPDAGGGGLLREAEWLETAHRNSADKGYTTQYRDGFRVAAGWVRFHAESAAALPDPERAARQAATIARFQEIYDEQRATVAALTARLAAVEALCDATVIYGPDGNFLSVAELRAALGRPT